MNKVLIALAICLTTPLAAQTANDDTPAIENWWDKVGADFFGPATMQDSRPEHEIRAQWTGLSADDQAAVLARCGSNNGKASLEPNSKQEGSTDAGQANTTADLADIVLPSNKAVDPSTQVDRSTTATGSVGGTEKQVARKDTPSPDTGLSGASGGTETKMALICDLIPTL